MRPDASRPIGALPPRIAAERHIGDATCFVDPILDLVKLGVDALRLAKRHLGPVCPAETLDVLRRILGLVRAVKVAEIPGIAPVI